MKASKGGTKMTVLLTFLGTVIFCVILILAWFAYPALRHEYRTRFSDPRFGVMKEKLEAVMKGAKAWRKNHRTYDGYKPPENDEVQLFYSGDSEGWHVQSVYRGTRLTCFMASGSGVVKGADPMPEEEAVCWEVPDDISLTSADTA